MAEEQNKKDLSPEETLAKAAKRKKMIFMILGAVVVLGVGGGVTFFLTGSKKSEHGESSDIKEEKPKESEHRKEDEHGKEEKPKEGEHGKEKEEKTKEGGHGKAEESEKDKKTVKDEDANKINFGDTYGMKPFHVNLGNPLENRYIRLEIAIEYRGGEAQKKELDARLAQIRDAVLSLASKKTREFLLGPDGKDQLRLEILNRINQYMDRKIESVYIVDMLIE